MPPKPIGTVFFDLGDTLGTPELSPPPVHLSGFHVFPFVPALLEQLKSRPLRLGIISNTGADKGPAVEGILTAVGILAAFENTLRIYSADVGLTKDTPEIFKLAATRAGATDASTCLFVGEDPQERATATEAGLRVCPHPLLAGEVIDGEALRYVRITAPQDLSLTAFRTALRARPIVPLHVAGSGGRVVYAITSENIVAELINMRLGVELLGDPGAPENTDLFLLRDDTAKASGFAAEGQADMFFTERKNARLLLSATPEGLIVALPHGRSLGSLHLKRARHGHTVKLMPDPMLLLEPVTNPAVRAFDAAFQRAPALEATLTPSERQALAAITPAVIRDRIGRYSGVSGIGAGESVRLKSRHISHPQNTVAVETLASDLESIGNGRLTIRQQRFTHRGRTLVNVEAELPGSSQELVLVTAHLDSTAASTPDYDEATDDAPGADDDASGIAAVLAIAERFVAMSHGAPLERTVRFVLFNAEEEGLVGSRVYARQQRSINAPIVAVYQMDMIGYNKVPPRSWEVHAGFEASSEVEARSVTLAKLIRRLAPQVSPTLDLPELFQTNGDPELDPASGRSDHASFQAHGYAAIVASEDFFVTPDQEATTTPDENPNYHTEDDHIDDVDMDFAADIARAIAAAAWITAKSSVQAFVPARTSISRSEAHMTPGRNRREVDTRQPLAAPAAAATTVTRVMNDEPGVAGPPSSPFAAPGAQGAATARAPENRGSSRRINTMTGTPVVVTAGTPLPTAGVVMLNDDAAPAPSESRNMVDRALAFVQRHRGNLGFGATEVAEFDPDPVVQRTSSGSMAVHLHQSYRGIPVFQMTRTVRFSPQSDVVDAAGDNAPLPLGIEVRPTIDSTQAALKAAQHLASTGAAETYVDRFKQTQTVPTIDVTGFEPRVVSAFPLPSRPTVLDKGPFENPIPAHLVIFNQPQSRLSWHLVLTFPDYADQYAVIVSADEKPGEIVYSKSTLHHIAARGKVFEFSPGIADRRLVDFPRPVSDYPAMPAMPIALFPHDWIDASQTSGNTAQATLNFGTNTLTGVSQNGRVVFEPTPDNGDDQKLLNIFYFCNYMHDFLFILGFDEAAGNFQRLNLTGAGLGGDPVRARAHSGAVNGTANMSTGVDGLPPVMNMGLVVSTGRHTAFDADVVFHEYTHGLTNRLVGGPLDTSSLDEPQSSGMGEGWSDFFALTIQNFLRNQEKVVTGDWVVNDPAGIRTAPYDDNFPLTYGQLANLSDEHDVGELWCAALMMMVRRMRAALNSDQDGYRLGWQIVVDGLKLTQSNPTFLDARDGILRALDDLKMQSRISTATHKTVRRAAWEAFAHFGMGANAFSTDAGLEGITEDHSLPPDMQT